MAQLTINLFSFLDNPRACIFFLLATLVCFLGIGLIVVMRKGWRDRIRLNDFSHFDFFTVTIRALFLMLPIFLVVQHPLGVTL